MKRDDWRLPAAVGIAVTVATVEAVLAPPLTAVFAVSLITAAGIRLILSDDAPMGLFLARHP